MSSDKPSLHNSQKEIHKETQKVGMQSLCCYSFQTDFHLEDRQAKGKAVLLQIQATSTISRKPTHPELGLHLPQLRLYFSSLETFHLFQGVW